MHISSSNAKLNDGCKFSLTDISFYTIWSKYDEISYILYGEEPCPAILKIDK